MNPDLSLQRYMLLQAQIDGHANNLTEIARQTGDNLEGNCFTNHQTTVRNEKLLPKRMNLLEIARHGKKIMELGFNAGHSALLLLLGSSPDAEIDFVDIGGHPYVYPCFHYLKQHFSTKQQLILGDSLVYLPKRVLKEGQRDVYDIIHMDGGHANECVVNDLILLYLLLKPNGYLIVDDAEGFIMEEVKRFISVGLLKPVEGQYQTEVYPHFILQKIA